MFDLFALGLKVQSEGIQEAIKGLEQLDRAGRQAAATASRLNASLPGGGGGVAGGAVRAATASVSGLQLQVGQLGRTMAQTSTVSMKMGPAIVSSLTTAAAASTTAASTIATSTGSVATAIGGVSTAARVLPMLFGPGGALVSAIGIATTALIGMFARARKEIDETARKAEQEANRLNQLQNRGDVDTLEREAMELEIGMPSAGVGKGGGFIGSRRDVAARVREIEEQIAALGKWHPAILRLRKELRPLQDELARIQNEIDDRMARITSPGMPLRYPRSPITITERLEKPGAPVHPADGIGSLMPMPIRPIIPTGMERIMFDTMEPLPIPVVPELELSALQQVQSQFMDQVDDQFRNFGGNIASVFADSLTAGFEGGFGAVGKAMLAGIGDVFSQIGHALIEYGVIMTGLLPMLQNIFTSGPAAIAAGIALTALGAAFSGAFSGKGGGRSGGGGRVGGGYGTAGDDITRYRMNGPLGSAERVTPMQPVVFAPNILGRPSPSDIRWLGDAMKEVVGRGIVRPHHLGAKDR